MRMSEWNIQLTNACGCPKSIKSSWDKSCQPIIPNSGLSWFMRRAKSSQTREKPCNRWPATVRPVAGHRKAFDGSVHHPSDAVGRICRIYTSDAGSITYSVFKTNTPGPLKHWARGPLRIQTNKSVNGGRQYVENVEPLRVQTKRSVKSFQPIGVTL